MQSARLPAPALVYRAAVVQRAYEDQPLLSTVPTNAPVDRTFDIQAAIGRIEPKVRQKGWVRGTRASTQPGYLATYTHSSGALLDVWDVQDERIGGQYYSATGVPDPKESFITYHYDRRVIHQDYMESNPGRVGIATVLCYEGLRHARQQGAAQVYVSMANKNSAALLRMLAPDEDAPSSKCLPCCFLVTACAEARGLPDDCEELTVLRRFRDEYMLPRAGGAELVALYYQLAPPILAGLRASADAAAELESIYSSIRGCIDLIAAGDLAAALQLYRTLVVELAQRFLPPEVLLEAQAIVASSPMPAPAAFQ